MDKKFFISLSFLIVLLFSGFTFAQETDTTNIEPDSIWVIPPPNPPEYIQAMDTPNDGGGSIDLRWRLSTSEPDIDGYMIFRSQDGKEFKVIAKVPRGTKQYQDVNLENGITYYYKVVAVKGEDNYSEESSVASVIPKGQWFNKDRANILISCIIFIAMLIWYTYYVRKGKEIFIRKIAGLAAIGDAVGRATEMGKPVLYVPGIGGVSDVQTLASLVILGEVAKVTAEYDTPLMVPCRDPIVMTAADEIVKESYMDVGRPDAYIADNIRFLTTAQFAYVAGVNGMMLRDRPAANLYMGTFYAESLMLAETGFDAGSIQVAGTAMVSQIPFFIAACDYTLIGEELFAASAYLSREPRLLVGLRVSDISKMLFTILTIIGVVAATLGKTGFVDLFIVK